MFRTLASIVAAALAAVALVWPGTPASAQVTVETYYAALGQQDFYNSQGTRLTSVGAILQQDRANFHRFGRRDPQDDSDSIFDNAERRALIPALVAAGDNGWWDNVLRQPPTSAPLDADVFVVVCTRNNTLSHIIINPANGDGYTMCEGQVSAGG